MKKNDIHRINALAQRIYLAKLCGFWGNPESQCALAEPCFSQCIDDASFAISAMDGRSLPGEESNEAQNGLRLVDKPNYMSS